MKLSVHHLYTLNIGLFLAFSTGFNLALNITLPTSFLAVLVLLLLPLLEIADQLIRW